MRHGACNAHHLRELQALIDIEKEDWAKSMHRLLERAHRATRFSRENGRDVPASLGARVSRAWARILDHAIAFHEAQPPLRTGKRGRKKRRIGHNLALRLRKHKEGCLRFLTDPRTPVTNNEAERDLRMAKLRQKISGGFRSERGAYNFARMRAVIATARKQGWNVLQTLVHPDPMQLNPNCASENTGTATSPDRHDPSHTNARANQTWVVTINHGNASITFMPGMRICQLIFETTLGAPNKGYQGLFSGQASH